MSKKLLSVGVVLALVAAVLVGVGVQTASAQTMSLCQTVDALVAAGVIAPDKVAAAKAAAGCGAMSSSYTFTKDLTVGSTGADVTALQNRLGVTPATGYFGAITKAAVIAYQTSKGITPASGYVGPITRAALNAAVVVTPTTPTTPTNSNNDLDGLNGTIDTISTLSQYSDEEVGEGDSNVKVAGFEVETSNDGDVRITSVKVVFDPTGNGAGDSDHLDDYIDGVSVWMGSTKVGSADVSDFTENDDDTSSKTIALNNAVVRSDSNAKFYVSVDAAGNLDSGDIDSDDWSVGLASLRYVDGSGDSTTIDGGDTEIGGGDPNEIGWDAVDDGIEIDFVDFGTAADTNLKVTLDTSSPDADIVIADDNDTTDGVVLLKGKIKVEGTSDILLDQLPITLTVTGATDVDNVTGSVTLTIDGEEYTESVTTSAATSATVTFDNLDLTLDAGSTYNFTIAADVLEVDSINFNEGDTLLASLTSDNRSAIDAENEEGDQLTASERSGTAIGEAQEFRTQGISVTLVSTDESVSNSDTDNQDSATFTIKFKVTAVGDDAYIATTVAAGTDYTVDRSGVATTGFVSGVIVNNTDTDLTSGYNWLIEEGTSETLTLTVLRGAGVGDGLYRAALAAVMWNADDSNDTYNSYTSNLDSFVTDYVSID